MNYKISNRVFLWTIVAASVFQFAVVLLQRLFPSVQIDSTWLGVILFIVVLIPSIVTLIAMRHTQKTGDLLHLHKFRISSAFMILVVVFLIQPLVSLLNMASQVIMPNVVAASSDTSAGSGQLLLLLAIMFLAPIFEEIIFRGVIFDGYEKDCGFLIALVLSSVLFGSYHMNFNQFFYTMILGVFLGMVLQATGSLFATMLMHFFFNSVGPSVFGNLLTLLPRPLLNFMFTDAGAAPGYYVMMLVLAAIFTPLAVLAVRWIAKNEGRTNLMVQRNENETEGNSRRRFVSPSLVIGLLIALTIMVIAAVRSSGIHW